MQSSDTSCKLVMEYALLLLLSPLCVGSKQTNAACCPVAMVTAGYHSLRGGQKCRSSQSAFVCVFARDSACVVVSVETSLQKWDL